MRSGVKPPKVGWVDPASATRDSSSQNWPKCACPDRNAIQKSATRNRRSARSRSGTSVALRDDRSPRLSREIRCSYVCQGVLLGVCQGVLLGPPGESVSPGFAERRTRQGWAARGGGQALIRSRGQQGGERVPGGRQIGSRPATGAAAVMRARPAGKLRGLAVGGGDGGGDQGDVAGVEVAEDGAQVEGDGGVAEAGGDPQDGLLGGCARQQPGLQGVQGGVPADGGERLAGADAGAGGDGAAEGVAVQEVPVADDQPGGGGVGGDAVGGVQELAGQLLDGDGGAVHGGASWEERGGRG